MQRPDGSDDRLAQFLVSRLEQASPRVTQPSLSLMSPRFSWVMSYATDIRATFDRVRAQQGKPS